MMNLWWWSISQEAHLLLGRWPASLAQGPSLGHLLRSLRVRSRVFLNILTWSYESTGPFELTKLSAQISVLMAKSNPSSVDDPVRRSYQKKGTFKTAKNIIMHRGFSGLYSGFSHHLSKSLAAFPRVRGALVEVSF